MVQGTASSAGKSTLVAGLCRLFARQGVRVAPFKAQNMSNNAAVTPDGGEIGRAQYAQAIAAGIEPTVDMNPILLKPQGGASQVIVRGRVVGAQTAAEYFGPTRRNYWPVVEEALDRLRSSYDLVVAEGAGSPAEINLRGRDIVNMRVALHAAPDADVLLVSDIDRGGSFAALLGTWEWLASEERALVRGFVLNKFRGDASLLAPAPRLLEERTGVPVVGVVPFIEEVGLPDEDSANLVERGAAGAQVEIAVIKLPHLSNFDEFGPLAREPGVWVRYVDRPDELRAPDLVVVPGSKATIPDLLWLHDRGLASRIRWLAEHDTPVLGICGGLQMLGRCVRDPLHIESVQEAADGLALLPLETELRGHKTLRHVRGHVVADWLGLRGAPVEGYEIHVGSTPSESLEPLLELNGRTEGAVGGGGVGGTYVHGVFESSEPRQALLRHLGARRGFRWRPGGPAADPYDRLADTLSGTVDLSRLSTLRSLRVSSTRSTVTECAGNS
jgi:adenosylcobyric acid synthase